VNGEGAPPLYFRRDARGIKAAEAVAHDGDVQHHFAESKQGTSSSRCRISEKRHPEIADWLVQIPCSRVQIPCSFAKIPCSAK
jgi:hypothetical protein